MAFGFGSGGVRHTTVVFIVIIIIIVSMFWIFLFFFSSFSVVLGAWAVPVTPKVWSEYVFWLAFASLFYG
jgi:lipopolysaccharide export LptBFGC system permease protein LptF